MEVTTLNTQGDIKSDFDLSDDAGRQDMGDLLNDMLRKGYALYLEDGDDTHRITAYDPESNQFAIRTDRDAGKKPVRIIARRPRNEPEKKKPGRPKGQRVNAVAPQAGG